MIFRRPVSANNPSTLLLLDCFDIDDKERSAISLFIQGLRDMTVERQASVTPNIQGIGGRTVRGIDCSIYNYCWVYYNSNWVYTLVNKMFISMF